LDEKLASVKMALNNSGEAEVVRAEPLGEIIRRWCANWLAERPRWTSSSKADTKASYGAEFMGPIDWLAEKTEIHFRRVYGIASSEFKHVPLTQADKILTAMGYMDMLGKEIPVIPNPNWSMERWMEYMESRGCV
jgi:hypothetical protein